MCFHFQRNKRLLEDISNTVEVSMAANIKKPSLKKVNGMISLNMSTVLFIKEGNFFFIEIYFVMDM